MEVQIENPSRDDFLKNADTLTKKRILSKWICGDRVEGDTDLDILFELDDVYNRTYERFRIPVGFAKAKNIATNSILDYYFI